MVLGNKIKEKEEARPPLARLEKGIVLKLLSKGSELREDWAESTAWPKTGLWRPILPRQVPSSEASLTLVSAPASGWLVTSGSHLDQGHQGSNLDQADLALAPSASHKHPYTVHSGLFWRPVDTPSPVKPMWTESVLCPSGSEYRKSGSNCGGRRNQWVKKWKKSKRSKRRGREAGMKMEKKRDKSKGRIRGCYGRNTSYPA